MTQAHHNQSSKRQTLHISLALLSGVIVGEALHLWLGGTSSSAAPDTLSMISGFFSVLTDIFLRLIKMIIAPLVFATLVVGMGKIGDGQAVGRIGLKSIAWFFSASVFSLLLGMVLVNIFEPGKGIRLELPHSNPSPEIHKTEPSLVNFVSHIFPTSITEAMAHNEILQIVVFSVFFGIASAQLGSLAEPMLKSLDSLAHIMLKVTSYVMKFAPVAVFSAIAAVIAKQGLGILKTYGVFIAEFYLGLLILWTILGFVGYLILGNRMASLLRHIREPILLAFATASSEAAYPKLLQQLERFGCDEKIAGFVLPLGYSFNLDGSMMYMTFAVMFIAQAYGIDLSLSQQLLMLFILLFTSKGVAGVPKASLVVIAGTLVMFDIPEAGLALILGIDQVLDMGRSASNVFGNSLAATVVSRWEKSLK